MKFCLVFLTFFSLHATISIYGQDYFLSGKSQVEAGNPEQAVAIWMQGYSELELAGEIDPRIGFSLIETITELRLTHLYQQAVHIYLWGLSADSVEDWKDEYQKEILRLKPLIPEDDFELWQSLLDDNNPELLRRIQAFWLSVDPMPSIDYNPRISEHWERIAHARENFVANDQSVYGTDDRGLIYVKYGQPDFIFIDKLQYQAAQTSQFIRQNYIERPVYSNALANAVSKRAINIFRDDVFIVWKYNFENRNISYFFGRPKGTGTLELLDSVLDLLPSSYNRYTHDYDPVIGRFRFNAGPFLQFSAMYQASQYDDEYQYAIASRYADIESITGGEIQALGKVDEFYYRVYNNNMITRNRVQDHSSWMEKNLNTLPVQVRQWRFLDEQNKPYTVSALFTTLPDTLLHEDSRDDLLVLRHNWTKMNETDEVCRSSEVHPLLPENFPEIRSKDNIITSAINCPAAEDISASIFSAELYDMGSDITADDYLTPDFVNSLTGLLAIGRADRPNVEAFESDTSQFIVSDIILGLALRDDDFGEELWLIHDYQFNIRDEIVLFYEVYNLTENPDGFQEYTVEYEIQPVRNVFQRLFGLGKTDRNTSLALTMEREQLRSSDRIEIRLAGLLAGNYEIIITFTDNLSGDTITRSQEFELVDS